MITYGLMEMVVKSCNKRMSYKPANVLQSSNKLFRVISVFFKEAPVLRDVEALQLK